MALEQFLGGGGVSPIILLLAALWTLPWKGYALWKAARNKHTVWFIVILIINTLAILEIIYIFGFSNRKAKVVKVKKK